MSYPLGLAHRFVATTLVMLLLNVAPLSISLNAYSDLSGRWVGSIKGRRSGTIDLTLSREGERWKAEVKIGLTGLVVSNPVVDLKVTDTEISFVTEIAGADAAFTGRLEGDKLVGTVQVTRGAQLLMSGEWSVERFTSSVAPPPTSASMPVQVQTPMPLQQPAVSRTHIVFSFAGDLCIVDRHGGDAKRLATGIDVADKGNPFFSPDGAQIAFTRSSGPDLDVYVVPSTGGEARRLTFHPKPDIAIRQSQGEGGVKKLAVEAQPSFYDELVWSPDSKRLAFSDSRLALWIADLNTGVAKQIANSRYAGERNFAPAWSPDGRWLAYAKHLPNRMSAIFLYSIETGKSYQISDGSSNVHLPVFDQNRKHLYFMVSNNAGPIKGGWEMSATLAEPQVISRLYMAILQKDEPSPLLTRNVEENGGRQSHTAAIDIEGIEQRTLALPILPGSYVKLVAGKPGIMFMMDRDLKNAVSGIGPIEQRLYKFDLSEKKAEKIAEGIDNFLVSSDGSKLLLAKNGEWVIASTDAPIKPGNTGRFNTESLEISVDARAEWEQMYHEAWRMIREYFIDPNSFGQDLKGLENHYAAYLPNVVRRSDLNVVFREMLSHLSISHMNMRPGDIPPLSVGNVGLLGADYQIIQGRYRITRIYRGDNSSTLLTSPLAQPGVNVKEGDYLLAMDGQEVLGTENVYRYFQGTSGRPVRLKIASGPNGAGARIVTVVPISGENTLRRYDWIQNNRLRVEQMSGGKLGYMYLPNFGLQGLEAFTQDYYAQVNKQGLIIDQRFSPGGATADTFIDVLKRSPLGYYSFRLGEDLPFPVGTLIGPKVLIINQFNGSAADTFPWMFREAGVGLLVGKRTVGAGIGPFQNPEELVDGGQIAVPNRAFYDPKKGVWLENFGVAPDIDVELMPSAWRAGHDPQLEKAVQVAMDMLKKHPRSVPQRPKYPVYK
ncbi:MAG: PDZ domain-containing protein [Acidobacteria bacterium]|nr:PDZ domain-containing protein [Acidobacteriota bacterium]